MSDAGVRHRRLLVGSSPQAAGVQRVRARVTAVRRIFYTSGQTVQHRQHRQFQRRHRRAEVHERDFDGSAGSHPTHVDTDFPVFRLADAYLMYAEATLRGGGGIGGAGADVRQRAAPAGVRRRERQHHDPRS